MTNGLGKAGLHPPPGRALGAVHDLDTFSSKLIANAVSFGPVLVGPGLNACSDQGVNARILVAIAALFPLGWSLGQQSEQAARLRRIERTAREERMRALNALERATRATAEASAAGS